MFSFRTEVEYHVATDHGSAAVRPRATPTVDDADTDPGLDEPVAATTRAGT